MKTRIMTVSYLAVQKGLLNLIGIRRDVPYIRLRGNWLKEAGFTIGTRFEVTIENGNIRLEPIKPAEPIPANVRLELTQAGE